jgi:MoxR-like ATPase
MDVTVTNRKVELNPIMSAPEILFIRDVIREIPIADAVNEYALKLVVATHPEVPGVPEITKKYISCGASPRAAQAIYQTSKARALMEGRLNVSFDDIKAVAYPALRHRLALNFEALSDGMTADQIIRGIIDAVKI